MSLLKRGKNWSLRMKVEIGGQLQEKVIATGSPSKEVAQEIHRQVERLQDCSVTGRIPDAELRRFLKSIKPGLRDRLVKCGLIEPATIAFLQPITEHLDRYLDACRENESKVHVKNKAREIHLFTSRQGVTTLNDMTPERLRAFLAELKQAGQSHRSLNRFRQSVITFANWCCREGLLKSHRLDAVGRYNESKDKRRARRAATDQELVRFLQAAPPDRRVKYLTILYSGLRRSEAKQLVVGDVDFERAELRIDRAITKTGEDACLPLHDELVGALRAWIPDDANPTDCLFDSLPNHRTVNRDLQRAGVDKKDARGHQLDLHALRTTMCTRLLRVVDASHAKLLTRHESSNVLDKHYNRLNHADARLAIAKLERLLPTASTSSETETTDVAPFVARTSHTLALVGTESPDHPREYLWHLMLQRSIDAGYTALVSSERRDVAPFDIETVRNLLTDSHLRAVGAAG